MISRSWIITGKLSERAVHLTQDFLCHLVDDPTQIAFMQMYFKVPITGTEDADLATLAQQIQSSEVRGELEAFKVLTNQGCSSVPRFFGYCKKTQGRHDLVPGDYVKYLVWEKVSGESYRGIFLKLGSPGKRGYPCQILCCF